MVEEEGRNFMQQMAKNIGKIRKMTFCAQRFFGKKQEVKIVALEEKNSLLTKANVDSYLFEQE
jgi:hypothetical protein